MTTGYRAAAGAGPGRERRPRSGQPGDGARRDRVGVDGAVRQGRDGAGACENGADGGQGGDEAGRVPVNRSEDLAAPPQGPRSGRRDHPQPTAARGDPHLTVVREKGIGADVQGDRQMNGACGAQPRRVSGGIQQMLPGDVHELDPRQQRRDRLLIQLATAPGGAVEPVS